MSARVYIPNRRLAGDVDLPRDQFWAGEDDSGGYIESDTLTVEQLQLAVNAVDWDRVIVPNALTPRQFRRHLSAIGKYAQVMAYMSELPDDNPLKIDFEYTTEFHRDNADLIAMFAYFEEDIDQFFINAAAIS